MKSSLLNCFKLYMHLKYEELYDGNELNNKNEKIICNWN